MISKEPHPCRSPPFLHLYLFFFVLGVGSGGGVLYFVARFSFRLHVAAILPDGELGSPSSVVKKTTAKREKPWGGEIINDGHRQTRAHFYQEEVEEERRKNINEGKTLARP